MTVAAAGTAARVDFIPCSLAITTLFLQILIHFLHSLDILSKASPTQFRRVQLFDLRHHIHYHAEQPIRTVIAEIRALVGLIMGFRVEYLSGE